MLTEVEMTSLGESDTQGGNTMTRRFEKIATIEDEIEALCLRAELEDRDIPHAIQSHYDSAYDGLFQFSRGWGHVEAPIERTDEIIEILSTIRQRSVQQDDEVDEQEDNPDRT
jgi:hypothetical protein